ncbi:MAG: hypothetical protein KGI93_08725, partial [Acidobacteriota bacterium]|nr:hypothetical protein [Acidobacteriota bacterium]
MHRAAAAVVASGVLAASIGLAWAGGARAAEQATLSHAAQRTDATGSLRFQLTARIEQVGQPPYVLQADGATSGG